MIGRKTGKSGRKWLWEALQRLTGDLEVTIKGQQFAGSIVGNRARDDDKWVIDINQIFVRLFTDEQFSFIDLDLRIELKGDFTKWLQGFVSTHSGKSKYSAEKLMDLSGSSMTRTRDFIRLAAKPAFEQLEDIELIKNFDLDGHLFIWER